MVKMRTLDDAFNEIKAMDPGSAVSKHLIRELAISGAIPTVMAGTRRLINVTALMSYFENPPKEQPEQACGIRPVPKKIEYRR